MKILIIIHGADSFLTDESYLSFLRDQYIPRNIENWEENSRTEWKKEIAKKWTKTHGSVYMPTMPNKQSARYRDWKMLFEELIRNITPEDKVTFLGNSLGGCFLLKYFAELTQQNSNFVIPMKGGFAQEAIPAEQMFPAVNMTGTQIQIDQIHLLAACISEGDFTPPSNYGSLQKLGSRVHIWHAEDDSVVPFSVGQEIARNLPNAETHFFGVEKGYGHFHGIERLPELESVILKK